MKDRVPTRPGRVLITPENGGAPFYATVVRADEPTENGDPMSKATFLQDATAALYGLGPDAVPDDVLALLGPYTQYWWRRRSLRSWYREIIKDMEEGLNLTMTIPGDTWYYANSITIDQATGRIGLNNPAATHVRPSDFSSTAPPLKGKYISRDPSANDRVYYISPSATLTGSSQDGIVTFKPGVSDVYTLYVTDFTDWEYIHSINSNNYPSSGTENNVEYQFLGRPLENAVSAPKIEIGSYVGTGTVGSSDPNTLVFSDVPALIFMYAKDESNPPYVVASSSSLQPVPVYILDLSRVGTDYGSYSLGYACVCKKSPDGRTVQWYCNSPSSQVPTYGAAWQFNERGTYYYYFAITKTRI